MRPRSHSRLETEPAHFFQLISQHCIFTMTLLCPNWAVWCLLNMAYSRLSLGALSSQPCQRFLPASISQEVLPAPWMPASFGMSPCTTLSVRWTVKHLRAGHIYGVFLSLSCGPIHIA